MSLDWMLQKPKYAPPLDPGFRPAALANRAYAQAVADAGQGVPLLIGLERPSGSVSRFETRVFAEGDARFDASKRFAERLLKFLLWQLGAQKIYLAGPRALCEYLAACYTPSGSRAFDAEFLGENVYLSRFEAVCCAPEDVPEEKEVARPLGRHLEGCRIGFDLGASDRKASAVVDGKAVFTEEVVWEPVGQRDPNYHYEEIKASIATAAAHMPRLDAIGGSAAGIYVDDQARVASLFRGIPKDRFDEIRNLFLRIGKEMGVPITVVNDGEVTALAGSMSLEDNGVLGIALGSSLAGGYVDLQGNIADWLNELAFCPIDYAEGASVEEWSGDRGVGARYLSQQCVFRLAPKAGIEVPEDGTNAARLKLVQEKLEAGHEGAIKIWQSMGNYLGYALAHFSNFYSINHVLILGRCTSGSGGGLLLEGANQVLAGEFPEIKDRINLQLPDEKSRRVGQSVAAASLPVLK